MLYNPWLTFTKNFAFSGCLIKSHFSSCPKHKLREKWNCIQQAVCFIPKFSGTSGLKAREQTLHCHSKYLSLCRHLCPSQLLWPLLPWLLQPVLSLKTFYRKFLCICFPVTFTHWPWFYPCGARLQICLLFMSTVWKEETALASPGVLPSLGCISTVHSSGLRMTAHCTLCLILSMGHVLVCRCPSWSEWIELVYGEDHNLKPDLPLHS